MLITDFKLFGTILILPHLRTYWNAPSARVLTCMEKCLEDEVHSVPHKKWIMSSGLWKDQLLPSPQAYSGSSHLLTTEGSWVLHPCSGTHQENKILLSMVKYALFLKECWSTAFQLLRWWNCCLSHWCCLTVCLDSERELCHQLWYGNGDSSHGRNHVLIPCLYSTSHSSHGLQLELLTACRTLNA